MIASAPQDCPQADRPAALRMTNSLLGEGNDCVGSAGLSASGPSCCAQDDKLTTGWRGM